MVLVESNAHRHTLVCLAQCWHAHTSGTSCCMLASARSFSACRILYLCGNLCFAEATEALCPTLMGLSNALIFYWPANNRRHFHHLKDLEEADLTRGLIFIGIDLVTELFTFGLLVVVARKKMKVDVLKVGMFLIQQHTWLYIYLPFGGMLYFQGLFALHFGGDPTFQFKWLQ